MTSSIRYVTIRRFAEATGYTENAIRTKIRDGVWLEGREWVKAPDGRILIDIEGYNAWVVSGSASIFPAVRGSSPASIASHRPSESKHKRGSSPAPLL